MILPDTGATTMRHACNRLFSATFILVVSAGTTLLAEPLLTQWNASLTTYKAGATSVQKVMPLALQRGSDLEGGARFAGAPGPAHVAFGSGYSAAMLGGIDLATMTWAQGDVDMALPTDGPSVVIGRTFNHRQNETTLSSSDGTQGVNWFQSAMPEIVFYAGANSDEDMVYLVLGAGRFLEYRRLDKTATEFQGVNGAPGVFKYVAGTGGNYDTYQLTDATGTTWTFWGGNTASHKADWQLWKKADAAGRTAYAGDKTTHSTAVSSGYNTDGTVAVIYQEYGTGSDERRYTFTYGVTINSVARLTQVKAEIKTSGTWSSPTGLTEIGRVSYDYYTASTTHATTTSDFFGESGDLKTVKVRTPLSDSGADLGSGVYDERTKYYRYYSKDYKDNDGERGHAHAIKLILGYEGARRYDWTGDSTFDDDFASTSVLTSDLKPYCDAYFEYDNHSTSQMIVSAFFNGECGCSGGTNGAYTFTTSNNSSFSGTSGYDTAWKSRAVIAQPDGSYQTRYFDETGQPLSTVVSNINPSTSGAVYWATGIDRNSAGRVITVHSPANTTGYTHSTGAMTYSTSVGLVTFMDRYASGEPSYVTGGALDGVVSGTGYREGTAGTAVYTSKSVLSARSLTVGSATVVRPLVTESRSYHTATSSYGTSGTYDATTFAYDWWNTSTSTDPLYITLKRVTTTLPAVSASTPDHNGQGVTHDAISYLRKDGRTAISVAPDYLQNWRSDVVALIKETGELVERYRYDAYGRPSSFSPADLTGNNSTPDGTLDSSDTAALVTTGSATWKSDLGNSSGVGIPDNAVSAGDASAQTAYFTAGHYGGMGLISDNRVDNRKGLAGYEFDPILADTGKLDAAGVPLYHVRNRVLNSFSGKWMQKDPLGYHDSMDLYEYCGSDSIDRLDTMGLAATSTCSSCQTTNIKIPLSLSRVSKADPQPLRPASDYVQFIGCDAYKDKWLLDPTVLLAIYMAGQACKGQCNGPVRVYCYNCDAKPGTPGAAPPGQSLPPGYWGGTGCVDDDLMPSGVPCCGKVTLCMDRGSPPTAQVVAHELYHVRNRCKWGGNPITDHNNWICDEYRAYKQSGECTDHVTCCDFACGSVCLASRFDYGTPLWSQCMTACNAQCNNMYYHCIDGRYFPRV